VVLAGSILPIVVVASGMTGSIHQSQASKRIAISTTKITLTSSVNAASTSGAAVSPAPRYVTQPGDTLSGIAARLTVRGGWPALYAVNRKAIGANPDVIRPGLTLRLPGQTSPFRYQVTAGDTLSGIAAALGVRGGWPALYAVNRKAIGSDPDVIRSGILLTIKRPAGVSPRPSAPGGGHPAAPSASAGGQHRTGPATNQTPRSGMPPWLKVMLLAAGLITGAAFLAEPVLAVRRRRQATARAQQPVPGEAPAPAPSSPHPAAAKAHIVQADYHRVVVTCSKSGDVIYVLRPPGADPRSILRVARLILPEAPYRELAGHLGMPASWPIVLADYDRLVVTCNKRDDTVCVLRPPGADPEAILRAARLVLPEGAYGELADQLGVPAGWPAE
jgi:LysM repeat protein